MIKTSIEWTDATWNPSAGCTRVSEGCRNCYAESMARRFKGPEMAYDGLVGDDGRWTGKIRFSEARLLDPLRWRSPRRIFVNSMSDLFHPNVSDDMRDNIFAVMALCPQHTFQVLTKRPERMLEYLRQVENERDMQRWINAGYEIIPNVTEGIRNAWEDMSWPLPNVWLGVSVEDQQTADERIPLLLQTPAAARFLSCEPLLGVIDLVVRVSPQVRMDPLNRYDGLDWVIVGGESGPHARPMHADWARTLRDQCVRANIPFFFKQWASGRTGRMPALQS